MVDTGDLKSLGRKAVRVQVPLRAPCFALRAAHGMGRAQAGEANMSALRSFEAQHGLFYLCRFHGMPLAKNACLGCEQDKNPVA